MRNPGRRPENGAPPPLAADKIEIGCRKNGVQAELCMPTGKTLRICHERDKDIVSEEIVEAASQEVLL